MKTVFKRASLVIFSIILLFSCKTTSKVENIDTSNPGIIEAEKFVNEKGGKVEVISGRVDASKDIIISWNNAGHTLEWKFYIAQDGEYKVVLRYCHNRKGATYREVMIDGKIPAKGFERVKLEPTGGWSKSANDWRNLTISDDKGNPILVSLKKGVHILTIKNLGGDGEDGAANFDKIAFLPKDEDPEKILGKAAK